MHTIIRLVLYWHNNNLDLVNCYECIECTKLFIAPKRLYNTRYCIETMHLPYVLQNVSYLPVSYTETIHLPVYCMETTHLPVYCMETIHLPVYCRDTFSSPKSGFSHNYVTDCWILMRFFTEYAERHSLSQGCTNSNFSKKPLACLLHWDD